MRATLVGVQSLGTGFEVRRGPVLKRGFPFPIDDRSAIVIADDLSGQTTILVQRRLNPWQLPLLPIPSHKTEDEALPHVGSGSLP